jgi:hypothetical protein
MRLSQVLFDEIWVNRVGGLPISRGYPSVWAAVEIWSKLDRFSRDTEILKLVIN